MNNDAHLTLRQMPQLKTEAAQWFHSKQHVPADAYLECMNEYIQEETEPGWYLCLDGETIIGGMGAIANHFHDRKDLTPMYAPSAQTKPTAARALQESCGTWWWKICGARASPLFTLYIWNIPIVVHTIFLTGGHIYEYF